jgi:hypothetical protein
MTAEMDIALHSYKDDLFNNLSNSNATNLKEMVVFYWKLVHMKKIGKGLKRFSHRKHRPRN